MGQIDALIAARDATIASKVASPAGILSGEVPVWNGSAWVRSSATGINTVNGKNTASVSGANTDLAWTFGVANIAYAEVTVVGGTLRNLAAPPTGQGARVVVTNVAGAPFTVLHVTGGTGVPFFCRTGANVTLQNAESMEFAYDGSYWIEISRNQAAASTGVTELAYVEWNGTISAGSDIVSAGAVTFDGSRVCIEFFCPEVRGPNAAQAEANIQLYDGASALGLIALPGFPTWGSGNIQGAWPVYTRTYTTPSAGSHNLFNIF